MSVLDGLAADDLFQFSGRQTLDRTTMLVAAGIQVIRAIGIKKLIPILAVGGLALGFMASRNSGGADEPAED